MVKKCIKKTKVKLEILELCIDHLKKRWNISNSKLLLNLTIILIFSFLTALCVLEIHLMNNYYHRVYTTDFASNFQIILIYIGIPLFFILLFLMLKNNNMWYVTKEIYYGRDLIEFANNAYKDIMNNFKRYKPQYKYFVKPQNRIEQMDDIVAHLAIMNLLKMYFNNMDFYSTHDQLQSKNNKIITTTIINLYKDKDYSEFYSKLFFGSEKKNKRTYYQSMMVALVNRVLKKLYTKSWFDSYYDASRFESILKFIIEEWYETVINHNMKK